MEFLRRAFEGHQEAWLCFVRGYSLQMQGKLDEAEEAYRQSIALHPTAEALTFLGWTYSFRGLLEDAIEYCRLAIETDPEFGNPYNDIGAYLLELGRPDEAIPWLKRAILAPRYEAPQFPHVNLGVAHEGLRQYDKALQNYLRALRIDPHHDFARARAQALIARNN